MMTNKYEKNDFRIHEYPIFPTGVQKVLLAARFDQEDGAYNTLAGLVNQSYSQGAGLEEPKALVQNHPILAENEVDRFAIDHIRKRIISLLPRLCSGKITCIKLRRTDRSQRSARYHYVGSSDYHLVLPVIGSIAMEQHRDLPKGARIYGATIYADCYYAFYHVALHLIVPQQPVDPVPIHYSKVVGLDYAQDGLYVDSSGHSAGYPAFRHQAQDKLNCCHRAANRFKTGSRRWRKFRQRAAKIERHVVNQRKDWQYKQAHALAQQYDAICVETLDLAGMMQNEPALSGKLCDNAPAAFYKRLEQVLNAQGKRLIRVDRYYPSSQICSACGRKVGKLPMDSAFTCPYCGLRLDRNHNAARNIREEGLRQLEQ